MLGLKKMEAFFRGAFNSVGLFYSFFVYQIPITFKVARPTALMRLVPSKYLILLTADDLGFAVIDKNMDRIAEYYKVFKSCASRGVYIPAYPLMRAIKCVSLYQDDRMFYSGFVVQEQLRLGFLEIGVQALLNRHPDSQKELMCNLESLSVQVAINAIIEGKMAALALLLKKYPEIFYIVDRYACLGVIAKSVLEHLVNFFVDTQNLTVFNRFLRYPFLINPSAGRYFILDAFPDSPDAIRVLRGRGALEIRPRQYNRRHVPDVHDTIIQTNIRKSVGKLKEDKTAEQIAVAYNFFKVYVRSRQFQEEVLEIAATNFGEGVLAQALKALSKKERVQYLVEAILGDGTVNNLGLILRMEAAVPELATLFKEYIGLVWLAIQEEDHLLVFQSKAAQEPGFDKQKEFKEIRLHVIKRLLDVQHIYLGQRVSTTPDAPVSIALNNRQFSCQPGTLGHIINILTLIDDRVIVTDEELTPEVNPNADFAQQLISENYRLLRHFIEMAYEGSENLKLLEDVCELFALEKFPDFSRQDYVAFFDNQKCKGSNLERTYKINLALQTFLGRLKMVIGDQERSIYVALEDVLKEMRLDTLGSLIALILHEKTPRPPVLLQTFVPVPVAAPASLGNIAPSERFKQD